MLTTCLSCNVKWTCLALGFTATKGRPPVFSNAAQDAQMDPIFSLYLKGGGKGEIMFGGLNKAKYDGKTKAVTKIVSQRKYIIMMDEAKFGETELCKKDGKVSCKALVDSGCSSIIGPAAVISPFIKEVLSKFHFLLINHDITINRHWVN